MAEWLGQLEGQLGLGLGDLQAALSNTRPLGRVHIDRSRCDIDLCVAVGPLRGRAAATRRQPSRSGRRCTGQPGSAGETGLQKSQFIDEGALAHRTGSQRHWILRGRIQLNLNFGDSPADTQAFVGKAVNSTA